MTFQDTENISYPSFSLSNSSLEVFKLVLRLREVKNNEEGDNLINCHQYG